MEFVTGIWELNKGLHFRFIIPLKVCNQSQMHNGYLVPSRKPNSNG